MRLKQKEIDYIKTATGECFGDDAKVYLFGSRVDDSKRGGDIDLYIETTCRDNIIKRKLRMLALLEKELGEQKIDIVVNNFNTEKFIYQIAKNEGIAL
jgi:predicted nucleotidyltransferase